MSLFRKIVFWSHLVTALTVGGIVLVMSVTGVLLTYQRQMQWWADTRGLDAAAPAADAARLEPEELIASASAAEGVEPTSVTWYADRDEPAAVGFGRERTVYVNAYTGAVLGDGSRRARDFFETVTNWHRWLALEDDRRLTGRAVTGAANIAFLFLVLSGVFLWWPRKRTRAAVRNVVWFRRGLSTKARHFNWHNVIGLWSAIPLVVIIASGAMISYPWATDLVYALGERLAAPAAPEPSPTGSAAAAATVAGPPGYAELLSVAERQTDGWESLTLQLPREGAQQVTFAIDAGTGGQPQRLSTLVLDRVTGDVVRRETFADESPGARLRETLRYAHTGELLGIVGQTVAGLVSLGAVMLAYTGLSLALRRFVRWRRRRGVEARSSPAVAKPR